MKRALGRTAAVFLSLGLAGSAPREPDAQQVWQADIQIRTLEIIKTKTNISARVVIYTERDDDAQDARLVILLPVGVGIDRLAAGCAASAGPSMVPALRAMVLCDVGRIPNHGFREVEITTTLPSAPVSKRFGVFTYSSTPDPVPGNNYAERVIP